MSPLLVGAALLLGSTLVTLQGWALRELYAIRIELTRNSADLDGLRTRIEALEAHR